MFKQFIEKTYNKLDNHSYKILVKEYNVLLQKVFKLQNDKIKLNQKIIKLEKELKENK